MLAIGEVVQFWIALGFLVWQHCSDAIRRLLVVQKAAPELGRLLANRVSLGRHQLLNSLFGKQ